MKPSTWRATATAVILVYLYVLAVQEILGAEVKTSMKFHTAQTEEKYRPPQKSKEEDGTHELKTIEVVAEEVGGTQNAREKASEDAIEFEVDGRDSGIANIPATRAVGYHPNYSLDPSYNSQNLHYSGTSSIYDDGYGLEFKYHNYEQLTKFLRTTSSRYPNLTALYSIGKSVQGKFFLYLFLLTRINYNETNGVLFYI